MLSFFKSQQPVAIVFFIILFGILKLTFFIGPPDAARAMMGGSWMWSAQLFLNLAAISCLMAQACLFMLAAWFNYLFHQADYHESNTMLPAVYFTLVTSTLPVFNYFNEFHLLLFLFLWLFRVLLQINSLESAKAESFNAGFVYGAIILLMPGVVLFLPFLFIILYILKSFRFHEFVLLLLGVITPIYLAAGVGYLLGYTWDPSVYRIGIFYPFDIQLDVFDRIILVLTGLYLIFSFVSLRGILFSVGFKRRKNVNMTIWFFLGMVAVVLGNARLGMPVLALLWLPVSIFLTLLILRVRRKKAPEILHTVFLLTIFIINILRLVW